MNSTTSRLGIPKILRFSRYPRHKQNLDILHNTCRNPTTKAQSHTLQTSASYEIHRGISHSEHAPHSMQHTTTECRKPPVNGREQPWIAKLDHANGRSQPNDQRQCPPLRPSSRTTCRPPSNATNPIPTSPTKSHPSQFRQHSIRLTPSHNTRFPIISQR